MSRAESALCIALLCSIHGAVVATSEFAKLASLIVGVYWLVIAIMRAWLARREQ